MKKRKEIAILMSAAMVFGMTACGSSEAPASSAPAEPVSSAETEEASAKETVSEEKSVLNFYAHSDNEKIAEEWVSAYNEAQDEVEVKLSVITNDDYDDKIKVMLSGGADVDVFWVRTADQARQMAQGGAILPLDNMMEANEVDYSVYGPMGDAFVVEDQTYALCGKKSCWLLWYNKTLFDEAGLEVPVDMTWDEYADLCAQLSTDGKRGGLAVNWILNTGAAAAGEYLTDENLTKTKEYIQFLNRIYNEDQSNMSLEEMSGSFDVNAVFAEGETYMMLNGDWTFLLFPDSNPEFEWGAVPLPHFEDVPVNTTVGNTDGYAINANCKNPEAAFDFLKYIAYSDEGASIQAKYATIPAFPSDEAIEVYKQQVSVPGTEYVFDAIVHSEDGNEPYYSELKDAFRSEITEYLIGSCSMDEAFENYKGRKDEIMNK